jgi:hypothetical protein
LEIDDDENINGGSAGTREEKTLKYALRNPWLLNMKLGIARECLRRQHLSSGSYFYVW